MPTPKPGRKPGLKPGLKPGQVPLERALSKLGLASRAQARELIAAGRVWVNGAVRTRPSFAVNPDKATIRIDGQAAGAARPLTLLLHKPKGVVTTRVDEKGRPTVFSLLKDTDASLHAVGRLDQATTGLLLLTNVTRLSAWLTDPESGVPRVYLATVRGEVTPEALARIEEGVTDAGERLRADRATLRKSSGRESHLTLELRQGKNREIRRLLAALGHEVTRLKRVAYGGLELGALAPGEYRAVTARELMAAFPGLPPAVVERIHET